MKCSRCPGLVSPESPHLIAGGEHYYFCPTCAPAAIAHATSTPTMTTEAMATPMPFVSRGKVFQAYVCGEAWHPSWHTFHDELETRELWWDIKPGDVVADVGADFGSYTLSSLAQGAAMVYAWSPPHRVQGEAIEAETLIRSVALNCWQQPAVVAPHGLWSEAGYLAVFDGPRAPRLFATSQSAEGAIAGQPGLCSAMLVEPLDSYECFPRLDWLKIDAEGAELHILRGARETIERCHPTIMLEHHFHINPRCETDCAAWLANLGYQQDGATRPHGIVAHSLYRWKR